MRRLNQILKYCLLLILIIFPLLGCWNSEDIESRLLISSLAIDKSDEGYLISIQVTNPRQLAGGGSESGEGGGAVKIFSTEGKTLVEALTNFYITAPHPPFLGHILTIFFSDEVTREGIAPLVDALRRQPEIRRRVWPVIIQGKAKDALLVKTGLEQIPTAYVQEMLKTEEQFGYIPVNSLGDLLTNLSTATMGSPAMNVIKLKKDRFDWSGIAIFKRDRLVSILNKDASIVLTQLRTENVGWPVQVNDSRGHGRITFVPDGIKRSIKVTSEKKIVINIAIEGSLLEKTNPANIDDINTLEQVEQTIGNFYNKNAQKLISKAQQDFKVDIFLLGHYIHAYHPELMESNNWEKQFPDWKIETNYNVSVQRMGLDPR